jgi:hypothetical protein
MDNLTGKQKPSLYSGGDGSTIEKAVVINATNTSIGVPAEYEYVSSEYGQQDVGWTTVHQSLIMHGGKNYDVLLVKLPTGEEMSVCFDITLFFGQP